jgi:Outer membrane protein Omp28
MKKLLLYALFVAVLASPGMAQFSIQKVVFEEFTGAWCQYCADGSYRAEQMDASFADALMIAVHNGDDMEIAAGTDLASYYSPSYPQAQFNRGGALVSRGTWSSTMSGDLQGASVVTVSFDSVGYDLQTRQLTATVRAMYTGPATGDMRLNLVIVEDNVTGTGPGYNQSNADNTTPGHPYQGAGNPIVGFAHRHVAREYMDGAWGNAGLIPTTANFGTVVTQTYNYTIPANFNEANIELVAFVGRYDGAAPGDRRILNGEEFFLEPLVVGAPSMIADEARMDILGNPLTERSKIVFSTQEAGNVRLEVLNMLGQQVAVLGDGFADKGIHTLYWDGTNSAHMPVDNGMYLVRMIAEHGQGISKRVLVAH